MAITLDTSEDYEIWDNTQNIKFLATRAGAGPDEAVVLAKRRAISTREMLASGGAYTAADVKFLIPQKPINFPFHPKPGDEIEDLEDGTVYTVLEVPLNKFRQTWHCVCRDLAIAFQLRDEIEIHKSIATTDTVGAITRTWQPLYKAVHARVQPDAAEIDNARGIEGQAVRFNVIVGRQLPLLNVRECRILVTRGEQKGRTLAIERYQNAERIGELPMIAAVLQP